MQGTTDIMVDLETMDTAVTASILSIGACRIDWKTGETADPFYCVIDLQDCLANGLTKSASTEGFWNKQSPEARKVLTDPSVSLFKGLADFGMYLKMFGVRSVRLWGNGSDFDNAILSHAYSKMNLNLPWLFYNSRCYRTAKDLGKAQETWVDLERVGVHHNALDDAIYQAKCMIASNVR